MKYQIEQQTPDGWKAFGDPHDSATMAEIVVVSSPSLAGKTTRIVPFAEPDKKPVPKKERAPWVPGKISDSERAAGIALVRRLVDDLVYGNANYCATLESIVIAARRLYDDEARLTGRGFNGPNKKCEECDGVYNRWPL